MDIKGDWQRLDSKHWRWRAGLGATAGRRGGCCSWRRWSKWRRGPNCVRCSRPMYAKAGPGAARGSGANVAGLFFAAVVQAVGPTSSDELTFTATTLGTRTRSGQLVNGCPRPQRHTNLPKHPQGGAKPTVCLAEEPTHRLPRVLPSAWLWRLLVQRFPRWGRSIKIITYDALRWELLELGAVPASSRSKK